MDDKYDPFYHNTMKEPREREDTSSWPFQKSDEVWWWNSHAERPVGEVISCRLEGEVWQVKIRRTSHNQTYYEPSIVTLPADKVNKR